MERFEPENSTRWRHYGEKKVAPLRRKNTGAITPEIQWLLYAGNEMAPLRRKLTLAKHLVITIGSQGEIEVEGKLYRPAGLPALLRQQMQAHPKLDVVLNGDKTARVEDLVRVMDVVRSVGIQHVAIAAKHAQ